MKISALWITKNEEKNIGRSIQSVAAIADEMVVVDTGSTDDTVKIAENQGARVEHFDWVNDFSAARNYGLDHVSGDIIVFLDADEWFEAALDKSDRKLLEDIFRHPQIFIINIPRTNIDPVNGFTINVDEAGRVIRGKDAARYVGPIHEFPQAASDKCNKKGENSGWMLIHNGYGTEVRRDKLLRNKALLDAALPEQVEGMRIALYHYYLMRECIGLFLREEALSHLKWLVDHPTDLKQFMRHYQQVSVDFPYQALGLVQSYRNLVSRRQLRGALADNFRTIFPDRPGSITFPLQFDTIFFENENNLLAKVDAAIEKAESIRGDETAEMGEYLRGNSFLYSVSGEACWRRGDREQAFDYASKSVRLFQSHIWPGTISLLLRTTKGLPFADIVLFLNSVLDITSRGILEMLLGALQYEGYKDLYTYYVKKMIDEGVAKKSDFWYLMIVLGRPEDACTAAMEAKDTSEEDVVQRTLFLAAAASQSMELFEQYKEEMGKYREALDLMFYNKADEKVNFGLVMSNYQLVAFAGGRPAANRLATAYRGFEVMAYTTQSNYYSASGLYEEFLEDIHYVPEEEDLAKRLWVAECEMMCGRTDEALAILEAVIVPAGVNNTFFNLCEALAARANAEAAAQARALYVAYHDMYEAHVDLMDVIRTEVVQDSDSKKQRRALAELDEAGFEKRIAPEDVVPFKGQLDTLRSAAGAYAKKKSYVAAVDCLCKSLSLGDTSPMTWSALGEIFATLENAPLAEFLRGRAAELGWAPEDKEDGEEPADAGTEPPAETEE